MKLVLGVLTGLILSGSAFADPTFNCKILANNQIYAQGDIAVGGNGLSAQVPEVAGGEQVTANTSNATFVLLLGPDTQGGPIHVTAQVSDSKISVFPLGLTLATFPADSTQIDFEPTSLQGVEYDVQVECARK